MWMVLTHLGASAFQVMLVPCVNKVRAIIAFFVCVMNINDVNVGTCSICFVLGKFIGYITVPCM